MNSNIHHCWRKQIMQGRAGNLKIIVVGFIREIQQITSFIKQEQVAMIKGTGSMKIHNIILDI